MGLYDPPGTAAYQLGSNLRSKLTGLWGSASNQALAQSNPVAKATTGTPTTTATTQPSQPAKSSAYELGRSLGDRVFGRTPASETPTAPTEEQVTYTPTGSQINKPFMSNPGDVFLMGNNNPTSVQDWIKDYGSLTPEQQSQAQNQFADYSRAANTSTQWADYYKNLLNSIPGRYDTALANIQNFATNNQSMLPNGQALVDQGWNSFQEKYQPTVDQLNNASMMAAEQARKNANYGTQQQIKYANEIAGGRGITGSGIYQSLVQQAGQNNARNYQQNVVDIYNANADRINSTVSGVLANLQSQGMQIDANTKTQVFNTVMQAMMDIEKEKTSKQLQYESSLPVDLKNLASNTQAPTTI